jgi:hypothetical protein
LINRLCFGHFVVLIIVSTAIKPTIKELHYNFSAVRDRNVNVWVKSGDYHCLHKRRSYVQVPTSVKIWIKNLDRDEFQDRIPQVSITEKQDDSCVDE